MLYLLRAATSRLLLSASIVVCGLCAALAAEPSAPGPSLAPQAVEWPAITPAVAMDPRLEARITALLGQLTLEQKVAQMVQADIRYVTPEDVRKYRLGSILNGGGAFPGNNKHADISDWVTLADRF